MTYKLARSIPIPKFRKGVVLPSAGELREAICDPDDPARDLFQEVAAHADEVARELDEGSSESVVTWQTPGGGSEMNICRKCDAELKRRKQWPRDVEGQYCQVSYGEHDGTCHICFGEDRSRDLGLKSLKLEDV